MIYNDYISGSSFDNNSADIDPNCSGILGCYETMLWLKEEHTKYVESALSSDMDELLVEDISVLNESIGEWIASAFDKILELIEKFFKKIASIIKSIIDFIRGLLTRSESSSSDSGGGNDVGTELLVVASQLPAVREELPAVIKNGNAKRTITPEMQLKILNALVSRSGINSIDFEWVKVDDNKLSNFIIPDVEGINDSISNIIDKSFNNISGSRIGNADKNIIKDIYDDVKDNTDKLKSDIDVACSNVVIVSNKRDKFTSTDAEYYISQRRKMLVSEENQCKKVLKETTELKNKLMKSIEETKKKIDNKYNNNDSEDEKSMLMIAKHVSATQQYVIEKVCTYITTNVTNFATAIHKSNTSMRSGTFALVRAAINKIKG